MQHFTLNLLVVIKLKKKILAVIIHLKVSCLQNVKFIHFFSLPDSSTTVICFLTLFISYNPVPNKI